MLLIEKFTNFENQNHVYIKLYFQNSNRRRLIYNGITASDNILVLSADIENLTVLNQQAVNTEYGMILSLNINQY